MLPCRRRVAAQKRGQPALHLGHRARANQPLQIDEGLPSLRLLIARNAGQRLIHVLRHCLLRRCALRQRQRGD